MEKFKGLTIIAVLFFAIFLGAEFGLWENVDAKLVELSGQLGEMQKRVIPSREQVDTNFHVERESDNSINTEMYSYEGVYPKPKVSSEIFDGYFENIQNAPKKQYRKYVKALLVGILLAMMASLMVSFKRVEALGLVLISSLSILMSIRLSEGWDEFYINLRHAYNLLNYGVYSVNQHSLIEASVDFIPLIGTTLLAALGLELVDSFIIMSLLGNIMVIIFSYLIAFTLTQNKYWSLMTAFIIGIYPNILWIGATGFSAVLFTGWMLAASYYILFTERRWTGLIFLSTLTLVRVEGILFAFLLVSYVYVVKPLPTISKTKQWLLYIQKAFFDGGFVCLPFLISLSIRHYVYGASIPNPVTFKSTGFDSGYIATGLQRLAEMLSFHNLYLLVLTLITLSLTNYLVLKTTNDRVTFLTKLKELLVLCLIAFTFIIPYHIGGGDWFPAKWNRYGLPFNTVLIITIMVSLYGVLNYHLERWIVSFTLTCLIAVSPLGYFGQPGLREQSNYFATLYETRYPNHDRWSRIDRLASLGEFFDQNLPSDAVVASPEEATIMYYSKREMLGLLGVSTYDMVKMPLQPMRPGDILHRRRAYKVIYDYKPDVIALYEAVLGGDYSEYPSYSEKLEFAVKKHLFGKDKINIAYYRVGSFDSLEKMGYRHFSIFYSDRIFSFFINDKIYESFRSNLIKHGFKYEGKEHIEYEVSPELTTKYIPGVTELWNS